MYLQNCLKLKRKKINVYDIKTKTVSLNTDYLISDISYSITEEQ